MSALKPGDRVRSSSYGVGTLREVECNRTGETLCYVLFDHPDLLRFGLIKCVLSQLLREASA